MPGVIPSEDAFERISRATKHYEQTYNNRVLKGTKKKVPGRGRGCVKRNEVWQFTIGGSPTGGTWDLFLNVLGTTETLTFDWDMDATDIQTELETHTNIASGDVQVTGGPFPNASLTIEFKGDLAGHRMAAPNWSYASLTGGSGVSVQLARYQPGHKKDGSVAP